MWCWRKIEKTRWARSREKLGSNKKNQEGDKYPTNNKKKEGKLGWSYLA
jgi:hypothetical protein